MSENTPRSFGVVGCGRIAQTYLEALSALPECRLKGVADVRPSAVESVAAQFGCGVYHDYRQLSAENHLDAVLVCTPPGSHCEITRFFLEAGVHVLCEKPFAMNTEEATAMAKTARETGLTLMMGSKFRYVEDIVKAKGIIESGILGEILLFENVFCSRVDMRDRWNSNRKESGGGVLIDNGSHSIDIARYLLGPLVKVQAQEGRRVQSPEVEDTCRVDFRTEPGVLGTVDLSWSISKEKDSYIDIFGTEGTLFIGWKTSKYRRGDKAPWHEFGHGYDKRKAFENQLRNFVGVINGSSLPVINVDDGLASVRVIEAAYAAMSRHQWVDVDLSNPYLSAVGK